MKTAYPHRIDGGPDRRFKVYQRDRVVGAPRMGGTMLLALMAASALLPYAIVGAEKGVPPAARWVRRRGPEYGRRAGDEARRLRMRGAEYRRRAGGEARRLLRRGPDAGAGERAPDAEREALEAAAPLSEDAMDARLEVLRAGEAWSEADARAAAAGASGDAHERAVAQDALAVALDALLDSARRAWPQDAGAQR